MMFDYDIMFKEAALFSVFLYFDFCFLNIFFQSNDFKLRKSHKSNLIFAHKQCNSSQIQHRKHHGEIAFAQKFQGKRFLFYYLFYNVILPQQKNEPLLQ